jgi:hypothetical protein
MLHFLPLSFALSQYVKEILNDHNNNNNDNNNVIKLECSYSSSFIY